MSPSMGNCTNNPLACPPMCACVAHAAWLQPRLPERHVSQVCGDHLYGLFQQRLCTYIHGGM